MLILKAAKVLEPPVKTRPEVDVEVLSAIAPSTLEDSFVYVHCHYDNAGMESLIRIWSTTYLIDKGSGSRSRLIHAENITMAPTWTPVPQGATYSFLLVFEGLPKSCKLFDLIEEISQPGGFEVRNIYRNETDVYHIHL
ncbi:MAG TPA: hypothetical protein VEB86_17090 [Chryseosolibacter sp.]|nr:hypothetical protein [Chryseosolibacter sp.]